MNSEKQTLWTTALTFTKTPSSVHPVYRPCLSFWVHCTDVFNFPNVGATGETKIPGVLQVNAPTYVIFSASVQPEYSADLAFSESVAPMSTISLSSVQPVIVNCLCFDLFDLDFFTVSSILVLWTEGAALRA